MRSPALAVEVPAIRRGRRVVLEPATLSLPPGRNVGVAGINGAGKSSLFLWLVGSLRRTRPPEGLDVALLQQELPVPDPLTGDAYARLAYGLDFARLVADYPECDLDVLGARPMSKLSRGERQLVLALVNIATGARVVLLDEPFASLDMRRREQLAGILAERRGVDERTTVVIASQMAADFPRTCQELVIIRDRELVFQGALEGLGPDERSIEERILELTTGGVSRTARGTA